MKTANVSKVIADFQSRPAEDHFRNAVGVLAASTNKKKVMNDIFHKLSEHLADLLLNRGYRLDTLSLKTQLFDYAHQVGFAFDAKVTKDEDALMTLFVLHQYEAILRLKDSRIGRYEQALGVISKSRSSKKMRSRAKVALFDAHTELLLRTGGKRP